jgi:hypothetical protein
VIELREAQTDQTLAHGQADTTLLHAMNDFGSDYCRDDQSRFYGHLTDREQQGERDDLAPLPALLGPP